jgi:hypothetical protein
VGGERDTLFLEAPRIFLVPTVCTGDSSLSKPPVQPEDMRKGCKKH